VFVRGSEKSVHNKKGKTTKARKHERQQQNVAVGFPFPLRLHFFSFLVIDANLTTSLKQVHTRFAVAYLRYSFIRSFFLFFFLMTQ